MKKLLLFFISILFLGFILTRLPLSQSSPIVSGAPPYDPQGGNVTEDTDFSWLNNWTRPEGPAKVALQVGHWKNDEVPEELKNLRGNTGASGGGMSEWEVNYEIASLTKALLEKRGIKVELLPATVPPAYWADVFVAVHADGNEDTSKRGFKVAGPRRDYGGNNDTLIAAIEKTYEEATGFEKDPNITRNMRGYYAFSWWRYEHAVHPMTASVILEVGFLTSPADRRTIVTKPEVSAQGLAEGIIQYLQDKQLIT